MGDQCKTFCFDWASLEPVYLNTLEMAFLKLVLVGPPTVESLVDVLVSAQQEEPVTSPEHVLGFPPPEEPHSKCFLTLRRRRRWKTCLLLLRR